MSDGYKDFLDRSLLFLRELVMYHSTRLKCRIENDKVIIFLTDKRISDVVMNIFRFFKGENIASIYFVRDFRKNEDLFVIVYKDTSEEHIKIKAINLEEDTEVADEGKD